jgi:DNA invertase Pin-like site-specific DNA recombinase
MRRLVGYVRVSTVAGRTDERFKSPDLQREVLRRWATAMYGQDHTWVGWFEDLDRTGTNLDRPALNDARALAVAEQADIVVYDLARFTRTVPEGLTELSKLADAGVQVLSATEQIDTSTPDGELSLTLVMALNRLMARRMSQSWQRTIQANREAGWWHGRIPYGYRRPTEAEVRRIGRSAGVIVPDAVTKKHVQEVFRRYLAGEVPHSIGRYGVAKGWFRKPERAREILGNPVYAGFVPHVRTEPARAKKDGRLLYDKNGRVRVQRVPGSERYYFGKHTPIIEPRQFARARRRLRKSAKPRPITTGPRWSAAGLTKCFSCGRNLAFHDKSESTTKAPGTYLLCMNQACDDRPGSVRVEDLERRLAAIIDQLPLQVRSVADELRAREEAQRASEGDQRRSLEAERQKLRSRVSRLVTVVVTGEYEELGLTKDEAELALADLRKESAQLERKLEALGPELSASGELEALEDGTRGLAQLWPQMLVAERVQALEALGAVIKIRPARRRADSLDGRIVLSLPFDPAVEFTERSQDELQMRRAKGAGRPKKAAKRPRARPKASPE